MATERISSELFTLRLWRERFGTGQAEWRGEIKNLGTGETRYFRRWDEIAELIPNMLVDSPRTEDETDATGE